MLGIDNCKLLQHNRDGKENTHNSGYGVDAHSGGRGGGWRDWDLGLDKLHSFCCFAVSVRGVAFVNAELVGLQIADL